MQEDEKEKKAEKDAYSSGITFHDKVNAPGSQFAGRDINNSNLSGVPWEVLEQLFIPVMEAVRQAPAEKQDQASATTAEIKKEVARGEKANDSRLAKLIDELVALAPGAASAVAGVFAQPVLAGLAGPVTKLVLSKLGLS